MTPIAQTLRRTLFYCAISAQSFFTIAQRNVLIINAWATHLRNAQSKCKILRKVYCGKRFFSFLWNDRKFARKFSVKVPKWSCHLGGMRRSFQWNEVFIWVKWQSFVTLTEISLQELTLCYWLYTHFSWILTECICKYLFLLLKTSTLSFYCSLE